MSGRWYRPTVTLPIVSAVLFTGFVGCFIYHLFSKDEEKKAHTRRKKTGLNEWSIEMRIPRHVIGAIIGRQGGNVRWIQDKTGTEISFLHRDDDSESTCFIEGRFERVEEAKMLIEKTIEEFPVIEYLEMLIPNFSVSKILGVNGDSVNDITRKTGANIRLSNQSSKTEGFYCSITVIGGQSQVKLAKLLIEDTIKNEELMQQQIMNSVASISKRNGVTHEPYEESQNKEIGDTVGEDFDKYLEGYVTAAENATHFWFQIKGNDLVRLDEIVEEMTDYYNKEINREFHAPGKLKINDMVAARFPHDHKWYRGSICKHEKYDDPSKYVVYFVDFGDTDQVDPEDVYELRTDFLSLKFQAIEGYLANLDPQSVSEETMQVFSSLVNINSYESIKIKILGYNLNSRLGIPSCQLLCRHGEKEVDVAEELVARGLAKKKLLQLSQSPAVK